MPAATALAVKNAPLIQVNSASVSRRRGGDYELSLHTEGGPGLFLVPHAVGGQLFRDDVPSHSATAKAGRLIPAGEHAGTGTRAPRPAARHGRAPILKPAGRIL